MFVNCFSRPEGRDILTINKAGPCLLWGFEHFSPITCISTIIGFQKHTPSRIVAKDMLICLLGFHYQIALFYFVRHQLDFNRQL